MSMSAATYVIADIAEILIADDWYCPHVSYRSLLRDEYGNRVHLQMDDELVKVTFEYVLSNKVETMYLDPAQGALRIAKIILAASESPDE